MELLFSLRKPEMFLHSLQISGRGSTKCYTYRMKYDDNTYW